MELLFLWIYEFRNIRDQGFSFSPKYLFKYEVDFEDQNFHLQIQANPNHIDNFFGANILNVSAIVGANGSGKSNLLDFCS